VFSMNRHFSHIIFVLTVLMPLIDELDDDEELDGPVVSALRPVISEVKQRWSVIGWVTKNYYL
jgi:hypothetical protein